MIHRIQINCFIVLTAAILLCFGCGTKTRVVLLPEADGSVGKVTMTSGGETLMLEKAYDSARSVDLEKPAERTGVLDEAEVKRQFAAALAAQPQAPVKYILNFEFGTAVLTSASKASIPEILESINRREMVEISVSGHTDRMGPAEVNKKLARVRAGQMAKILMENGVPESRIVVESHGEGNPLVPTADGVAEPRNRRVEVVIR